MTHFVFDGSNHDWTRGVMDVAAMAADGIEGGWHKFADGLNYYTDPYFPEAARRMRASSFKFWGAYHVVWGNRDINAQADWQISLLDQQVPGWRTDPKFRLVSDDEPFTYNQAPSIAQINQYHDRWAQRVPGVVQLAYAPRWYYGSSVAGIRYPVIASNYGSNPAVHYPTGYPGDGSSRWADNVLQFGSLLIQGTQTQTDCNAVKDTNMWSLLVGTTEPEEATMFLAQAGSAAGSTTQYYRCDGMRSVPITREQAIDMIGGLVPSGAITLQHSASGGNDIYWTSIAGVNGTDGWVRMGWSEAFGALDVAAVEVDAGGVADALAGNPAFLAAMAKTVNDDAAKRRQGWS